MTKNSKSIEHYSFGKNSQSQQQNNKKASVLYGRFLFLFVLQSYFQLHNLLNGQNEVQNFVAVVYGYHATVVLSKFHFYGVGVYHF